MSESILAKNGEPEDWRSSCSDHFDRMSFALEHVLFSDVSFLVGDKGEVIQGLRGILSIGSPIFQAMLTGKSFDESPISIPNIQPCGFKPLLKYFYVGKIPKIPEEDYLEFFKAVKYFKVKELYKVCREHILKMKLKLGNVIDMYENCKVLEEKELVEAAESFINRNAASILAQQKFSELSAQNLLHFISSDDFSAPEVPICLAVYKWGEAECKRQKLEMKPENLRLVLKDIIPQIRFPLMNSEDFAIEIAKLNLPTHAETVLVHSYFFARHHKRHQIPEGVRFISKPRKRVKYEDQDGVDNIVWNLKGRINTGLRTDDDTIYMISNKGVGSPNYLNVYSDIRVVVATKELAKYEFGRGGYCSTFWGIRRGSKPNTYTLFSKFRNGYLTWMLGNSVQIFGPEYSYIKYQNLTFEPSKKSPGYFLMTTESKDEFDEYLVMGLGEDPSEDGFYTKFMKKPEGEVDSILWKIQKIKMN